MSVHLQLSHLRLQIEVAHRERYSAQNDRKARGYAEAAVKQTLKHFHGLYGGESANYDRLTKILKDKSSVHQRISTLFPEGKQLHPCVKTVPLIHHP